MHLSLCNFDACRNPISSAHQAVCAAAHASNLGGCMQGSLSLSAGPAMLLVDVFAPCACRQGPPSVWRKQKKSSRLHTAVPLPGGPPRIPSGATVPRCSVGGWLLGRAASISRVQSHRRCGTCPRIGPPSAHARSRTRFCEVYTSRVANWQCTQRIASQPSREIYAEPIELPLTLNAS